MLRLYDFTLKNSYITLLITQSEKIHYIVISVENAKLIPKAMENQVIKKKRWRRISTFRKVISKKQHLLKKLKLLSYLGSVDDTWQAEFCTFYKSYNQISYRITCKIYDIKSK